MTIRLSIKEKRATVKFLSSETPKIFQLKNELSYGIRKEKQKKGKEKKK